MASGTKETKDKLTKEKPKAKKGPTASIKASSDAKLRDKCPDGQIWNPHTGKCE